MAVHRLSLTVVRDPDAPAAGAVVFDDLSGRLRYEGGAEIILARDRERYDANVPTGGDRGYGELLAAYGWSNGYLALVRTLVS